MSRALRAYIAGVVALSTAVLVAATLFFEPYPSIAIGYVPGVTPSAIQVLLGVAFWTVLTLVSWALPVRLSHGTQQAVANAPMLAAIFLGGPAVGAPIRRSMAPVIAAMSLEALPCGWVAALGTTEARELRGKIPWYGTLANHAGIALPA